MGEYYGSTWGNISGKVGQGVGFRRHGKNIVRAYRPHPNIEKKYRRLKKILDEGNKDESSYASQLNMQKVVYNCVFSIAKTKLREPFIRFGNL